MYRFPLTILSIVFSFHSLPAQLQQTLHDSIITVHEARRIVGILAADSLRGRLTGTDEAIKAAVFIADEFAQAGGRAVAGLPNYFMTFGIPHKDSALVGVNVVAALPGKSRAEEIVIFSAHYDHVGSSSSRLAGKSRGFSRKDEIYNGANDNASGVAAVILLARYFASLHNNVRTLLFIAFSGEELGLLGSHAFSNKLEPLPVKAVVNIEMIGRKSSRKVRPYITGDYHSNLLPLLNAQLANLNALKYGKTYFSKDPYHNEKLFFRSDNWPFATLGIPAHSIMLTAPDDRYYHSPGDEVKTIDFESMVEVTRALALSTETLVSGTSTPTRINPKNVQ